MKRIILFILVASLFLVGNSIAAEYGYGFKSGYDYLNNDLRAELEKEKIPYIINPEGAITYPQKYSQDVEKIIKTLKERPIFYIYDSDYLELLEKTFSKLGIKYVTHFIKSTRETHLLWNLEDDEKVRKILRLQKSELVEIIEN